jgi:U3 small nucleolar RNA-associated protein 5
MHSSSVKLVDISSGKRRKLEGHFAGGLTSLVFTQCGKYLVCIGKSSREFLLFDLQADKEENEKAIYTAVLRDIPIEISARTITIKNTHKIEVLVTFENIGAAVYRLDLLNTKQLSSQAMTEEIANITTDKSILSASFCNIKSSNANEESKQYVVLALATDLKPSFQSYCYTTSDGHLLPDILAGSAVTSAKSDEKLSRHVDENATELTKASPVVVGPDNMKSSKRPIVDNDNDATTISASNKKSKHSIDFSGVSSDLTLEERLESLSSSMQKIEDSISLQQSTASAAVPTSDSLVTLIDQALQSGDDALLEQCLACEDMDVIIGTAKRFPVHRIVTFLKKLVAKFEKRPSRGILLTRWLSSMLKAHTSFLISVPNLASQLSGLSQMLEQRMSSYARLAALGGRLDLLMAQVSNSGGKNSDDSDNNAAFTPNRVVKED